VSAALETMLDVEDAAIAGEVESTDLARIHLTATGAAIGWATAKFTTACCVTLWVTLF
jgi:hypothetical protein